ncbi:MAG TPA: hypothetical protein PKC43_03650 [Phycisphaerales bacterium]|nr:hypothetical protein [Phycisphaerales bacterium]HMP36521.1 hypothetical protein [Phycisphaerales bacterium]
MSELFASLFADHAAWFAIPALIGTLFFGLRLVLSVSGLDAVVDVDGPDVPADVHQDSTALFKFFSIQSALMFCLGAGWTGLAAYRGLGMSWSESAIIAVIGGVASAWLLLWLLGSIRHLEAKGNIPVDAALGCEGDVYVTVPSAGSGRGQVRVTIGNRQRTFNALSSAGELRPPARVRVVQVNADRSLTVAPADACERAGSLSDADRSA